ncbi:MAG: hypothetical protein M3137_19745 [Actinomycetota bacterium]|nr:hypothetical protein [Actinomycetota bacterium]
MSTPTNSERRLGDTVILAIMGVIGAGAVGHWLVANLATLIAHRRRLHVSVGEAVVALRQLPDHWGDPRRAWPEPAASQLPGPVVYWISIGIVAGALIGLVVTAFMFRSRRHEPADKRRRVGVATQPRLARTRDLRPLLTRQPEPGRFVLARWRRRYLSTEADVYRRRRGVRGAVIVFGPSQSGKTTSLIMGVESWDARPSCRPSRRTSCGRPWPPDRKWVR